MLDEQGIRNLFQHIHELWIQPELDSRFGETGIPEGFKVREALIKLPSDSQPIVEFNEEIQWVLEFKARPEIEINAGQTVYLHEVENVDRALAPTVNGNRVAFVYLYWAGYSYKVLFDFLPNHSDFDEIQDGFWPGATIAEHVRIKMMEKTVHLSQNVTNQLRKIGLWTITPLLPYPMSRIVERIGQGKLDEARQVLIEYCDITFLTNRIVSTWTPVKAFSKRMAFFEDALFCHENGRYRGSISLLVGHIEGVITDWLFDIGEYTPQNDKYRSLPDKMKDFKNTLSQIPNLLWFYREALATVTDLLTDKKQPWLQNFKKWLQPIDSSFPGRHVVQHGKSDLFVFTEENSIKLFLLLDTICQFMMFYEVRVMERDLGENRVDKQ